MKRGGTTYIMANPGHSVLYVGVTSELENRVLQHKNKEFPNSLTAKYNCIKLVYYESFHSIEEAIARESSLKIGKELGKMNLLTNIILNGKTLVMNLNN